ncbi:hypothetical protein DXG01_001437 [Tephrocybe rancida]|nr:hypothetical protein DXG01_001437 [Tephrocybe rancida]
MARNFRHYYPNTDMATNGRSPSVLPNISIEDHTYISVELCEFFTHQTLFTWVSAENCANIYNQTLSNTHGTSHSSSITPLTSEQVSRGFVLNALLHDCIANGSLLVLPDIGNNDERLRQAQELQNHLMIMEGQPEKMHACNKCEKIIPREGGGERSLHAATMDGTSLNSNTCKEHNCTQNPIKHCAHFCAAHEHKKFECIVVGCSASVEPQFQTCKLPEHRKLELHCKEKKKAFFQLKQCLQKCQTSQIMDTLALSDDIGDDDGEEELIYADTQKSDLGNVQPKARFER